MGYGTAGTANWPTPAHAAAVILGYGTARRGLRNRRNRQLAHAAAAILGYGTAGTANWPTPPPPFWATEPPGTPNWPTPAHAAAVP